MLLWEWIRSSQQKQQQKQPNQPLPLPASFSTTSPDQHDHQPPHSSSSSTIRSAPVVSSSISLPPAYLAQVRDAALHAGKQLENVMRHGRLPAEGWSDAQIEAVLHQIALLDSNNVAGNVGVGEREARVFCSLVRARHYGLAHGIGRSGDLCANQPKAVGSSVLLQLASKLATHALHLSGLTSVASSLIVPAATGIALSLVLLTLRSQQQQQQHDVVHTEAIANIASPRPPPPPPPPPSRFYVILPRIDQKTCVKCIETACATPWIVPLEQRGDELVTSMTAIERALDEIAQVPHARVLCVMSVSSCFAPRAPDDVVAIARLCKRRNVAHLINNAYGVQSRRTCEQIESACRRGRVDAIVQSTDKNFMVPVGGALIASPSAAVVDAVSHLYPGRASNGPIVDLFITLLSMGQRGYVRLLSERERQFPLFQAALRAFAERNGERLLHTPSNPISMAMALTAMTADHVPLHLGPTYFGSMLYIRNVSGPRCVYNQPRDRQTRVGSCSFANYGAHSDTYSTPYVSVACAIGLVDDDIPRFVDRMQHCWNAWQKQCKRESDSENKSRSERESTSSTSSAGFAAPAAAAAGASCPSVNAAQ